MDILKKFGIETDDESIYQMAFTHGSYSAKYDLDYNYERLEFLGDSVLSVIVSGYLYNKYPEFEEGKLTKIRANYVCQNALIFYSHELGLTDNLRFSEDEGHMTESEVLSITADIFESFLGAVFIDQGMDFAKKFVSDNIFKYIDDERVFFRDYKSAIKEYGDANEVEIEYKILQELGVPHDKLFVISIWVDGKEIGVGKGKNKKEAEQAAAKIASDKLKLVF